MLGQNTKTKPSEIFLTKLVTSLQSEFNNWVRYFQGAPTEFDNDENTALSDPTILKKLKRNTKQHKGISGDPG